MNSDNFAMLSRIFALLSLLILQSFSLIHSSIGPPRRAFNISHFMLPKVTTFVESSIPPEPPNFFQGVLDAIATKEKWAAKDIRISRLDAKKSKYRPAERYEFLVRVGKTEMLLKMYDEVSEWNKLVTQSENGSSNFEDLARKIDSKAVISSFEIEGPFELRVAGDDDSLSLTLPLNISHSGLRRISVGEGITVKVKGAEEISLFHPSDHHQLTYGAFTNRKWNEVGSIWPAFCKAQLSVNILGSASVVAYRSKRPAALVQTAFPAGKAIKLLPDKCYIWPNHRKPNRLYSSLHPRIILMEKALRKFLNERGKPYTSFGSLKTRIRASYIFQFQLQMERDIRVNDTYWSTLDEWRTKPTIEYSWFEVLARIEGNALKPLGVKKVRPFIDADSLAWSSLLSNISFTKFPSVLLPSEALTLDVKW